MAKRNEPVRKSVKDVLEDLLAGHREAACFSRSWGSLAQSAVMRPEQERRATVAKRWPAGRPHRKCGREI